MTIAVSDTSPLNYLILCGAIDVLPSLFRRVLVPPAVLTELRSHDAPSMVRAWIDALPPWVAVQMPSHQDSSLSLHSGECEAICLAIEIHAEFVVVDDRAARRAATERGLCVIGTLGVLERAAATNLLSLPTVLDALGQTTFKIAPALIEALRERDAKKRR